MSTIISKLFYVGLGLSYFAAFWSVREQYAGLFSINGLLPTDNMIASLAARFQTRNVADLFDKFHSVSLLAEKFGVTIDAVNETVLIIGIIFSGFAIAGSRSALVFAMLWYLYFNVYFFGQVFFSFQWDVLLLEMGVLGFSSLLLSSVLPSSSGATNWCYRFLAFKLMFLAGIAKLQSRCPTWETLTALEYHFGGQPIPTPISWFFFQLPPIALSMGVAFTLVVEILSTIFLLAPSLAVRRLSASLQLLLQVLIALSGNYNFFNLLTALLMLKVWESDGSPLGKSFLLEALSVIFFIAFLGYSGSLLFQFQIDSSSTQLEWWRGERLELRMKWDELFPYIRPACIIAVLGVISQIILQTIYAIFSSSPLNDRSAINSKKAFGFGRLLLRTLGLLFVAFVSCTWVLLSSIPLAQTCGVNIDFLHPPFVKRVEATLAPWHVVSAYGLFRRMTGVGTVTSDELRKIRSEFNSTFHPSISERTELVIEGFDGVAKTWIELPFRYKPGDLLRAPSFIAPLQPRLDWQMWFAALGSYEHNPWLVHLVHKLLQSPNSTVVHDLMDASNFPVAFATNPPEFVRVMQYDYVFSRLNTSWARLTPRAYILPDDDRKISPVWWTRYNAREYIPPVAADNPSVKAFLEAHGLYASLEGVGPSSREGRGVDFSPLDLYRICIEREARSAGGGVEDGGGMIAAAARRAICSAVLLRDENTLTWLALPHLTKNLAFTFLGVAFLARFLSRK